MSQICIKGPHFNKTFVLNMIYEDKMFSKTEEQVELPGYLI